MSPRSLFRLVALAEAISWTLLLAGMVAKYGTKTTDVGVSLAGPVHGLVFLAFCLVTALVAVDQRWPLRHAVLAALAAVLPLATVPFEHWAVRHALLGERWRLRGGPRSGLLERLVGVAVTRPGAASVALGVGVMVVFAVLLALGPPVQVSAGG